MIRLFIGILAMGSILVLIEGRKDRYGNKAAKKCSKNTKKFNSCLVKGYKSKAGCSSGDNKLKKKSVKNCARVEKRLKNCNYACKKPEQKPEYKTENEPKPESDSNSAEQEADLLPESRPRPDSFEPEPQHYEIETDHHEVGPDQFNQFHTYDLNCMLVGINFIGADIRHLSAPSLEECAMVCSKEADCKSITFRPADTVCWLKNKTGGIGGPLIDNTLISMNMECKRSGIDMSCKRDNTNFGGADISSLATETFEICAKYCQNTEECQSFSFMTSASYCWLKNKRGGRIGPMPYDGIFSMNIDCFPQFDASNSICAMDEVEFVGGNLNSFKSRGNEDCRTHCFDTNDCLSYALRKSDNYCWLKTLLGEQLKLVPNVDILSTDMKC